MDITYTLMLPILQFLDKTLGSYGWAILGLTLAVRIAVWPLVAASTKSMQRMSQLQPKLKALQDKYKDQPEVFQKKMAEFYMKNKINPVGGCLPLLVQLPILFALFGTFNGPPFQDKPIPVTVKVLAADKAQNQAVTVNPASGSDSVYVSKDGQISKLVVRPGDSTIIAGKNAEGQATPDGFNAIDYSINPVQGVIPTDFKAEWKIANDPNRVAMSPAGQATFPTAGEITIEAVIPATLTGSEEKTIPVKVLVLPGEKSGGGLPIFGGSNNQGESGTKEKSAQSDTTVEIRADGKKATVAVEPGNLTVNAGKTIDFKLKTVDGIMPAGFYPLWRVSNDPNAATIDQSGKALFKHAGEIKVEAVVPGEAKNEPFYFITNIGKVAKGTELLEPKNWDVLSLIILFGVTMVLSQKLMVTTPPSDPDQAAIQKQTQQIMPITLTAMFFFMPLPAGVFLYMVFSNVVQTLQTWILTKQPAAPIIDIDEDGGDGTITLHPLNPDKSGGDASPSDKSDKKPSKPEKKQAAKDESKSGGDNTAKTGDNTGGSVIKLTTDEKQGKSK